jgi:hypothetical protein
MVRVIDSVVVYNAAEDEVTIQHLSNRTTVEALEMGRQGGRPWSRPATRSAGSRRQGSLVVGLCGQRLLEHGPRARRQRQGVADMVDESCFVFSTEQRGGGDH